MNMTEEELSTKTLEGKWVIVRNIRNDLLNKSDWTQLNDSPVNKITWQTYRDELRDIPQNFSDPDSVIWPTPPV